MNQKRESKHEGEGEGEIEDIDLPHTWNVWICMKKNIIKEKTFQDSIKKFGSFSTAKEFWGIIEVLPKIETIMKDCSIYVHKDDVFPMWENEDNKEGGSILLQVKKEHAQSVWEKILMVVIGDEILEEIKHVNVINGVSCKIRTHVDTFVLEIWLKTQNKFRSVMVYLKKLLVDYPIQSASFSVHKKHIEWINKHGRFVEK